MRSFRNIVTLNAGFQQDHFLIASFEFSPLKLHPESQMTFKHELLSRVQAIPGVNSAAEILEVPMSRACETAPSELFNDKIGRHEREWQMTNARCFSVQVLIVQPLGSIHPFVGFREESL